MLPSQDKILTMISMDLYNTAAKVTMGLIWPPDTQMKISSAITTANPNINVIVKCVGWNPGYWSTHPKHPIKTSVAVPSSSEQKQMSHCKILAWFTIILNCMFVWQFFSQNFWNLFCNRIHWMGQKKFNQSPWHPKTNWRFLYLVLNFFS